MKRSLILTATILVLWTSVGSAQTLADEQKVIEFVLAKHFTETVCCVDRWVASDVTQPLDPGDFINTPQNYLDRNKEPLKTSAFVLPANARIADLSKFSSGSGFNWDEFETAYGAGAWTLRLSRPGFPDKSTAVIRVDTWRRHRSEPSTSVETFKKLEDGSWIATASRPAFR